MSEFRMAPKPSDMGDNTIKAMVDGVADLTVAEFKKLGDKASFHLADDSGREWQQGHDAQKAALELFDAHPELHARMREVAQGFLWSLKMERPA